MPLVGRCRRRLDPPGVAGLAESEVVAVWPASLKRPVLLPLLPLLERRVRQRRGGRDSLDGRRESRGHAVVGEEEGGAERACE